MTVYAMPETTLSIDPASASIQKEQQTTATISVDTGNNKVVSVDIIVQFDPTVLEGVSAKPGNFLPNAQLIQQPVIDNSTGRITISMYTTRENAASGKGTVAALTFKGKNGGSSAVSFHADTVAYGIGEGSVLTNSTSANYTVTVPSSQASRGSSSGSSSNSSGGGGGNSTSTPSVGTGLLGAYFNNNNFTEQIMSRRDWNVNFNWGLKSPDRKIAKDTYSVRWTGSIKAPHTGKYTFYARGDDQVRIYVNNRLIANKSSRGYGERSGKIDLLVNQHYPIQIEYVEQTLRSSVYAYWSVQSVSQVPVYRWVRQRVLAKGKFRYPLVKQQVIGKNGQPQTRAVTKTVIKKQLIPGTYLYQ